MRQWTEPQKQAIHSPNRTILVSAAAGSGKTSVLIERLMHLLRNGASLDRMLVVTFTRAAAAQMKERLGLALQSEARESLHLRQQYQALGSADIGTLHSFCKKLIERHFQAVEADPLSRVGDEGRNKELFDRALSEEMETLYENPGEDGQHLIDQYAQRSLEELVRELYRFLMGQAAPWAWLQQQLAPCEAADIFTRPWYLFALEEAQGLAAMALNMAGENVRLCQMPGGPLRYLSRAQVDAQMAQSLLHSLQRERQLPPGISPRFDSLPGGKIPPQEDEALRIRFQNNRKALKTHILACAGALPCGPQEIQTAVDDIRYTLPALRALAGLTRRVHSAYQELKAQRQLLDYSDLEHMALACLQSRQVRLEVMAQYDAIFVDEYQDISRIQDAVISALQSQNSNLFMVGDVKQSIYRFRMADPGLFMEKYNRFDVDADADERVIHLSENFRSRPNILRAVNHVFHHTLRGNALEINYDAEAALRPGLPEGPDPRVEMHIILPGEEDPQEDVDGEDDEERAQGIQMEAAVIAKRAHALRATTILQDGRERAVSWRDMVVLLRSASKQAQKIAEVLTAYGIPVYSDADSQYFDVQEVQDTLNLLQVLDNPYQDELLLSVLAAPPFNWTPFALGGLRENAQAPDEPLYRVFFRMAQTPSPAQQASEQLEQWRFLCHNTPLDNFLRRLISETGLYTLAGAKPQGELRRANLRLLCQRAGPNPYPQSLHEFLGRVHEARIQDNAKSAATLGAGEDVLRIMTIHKSKGLEFPVVFMPSLSKRFRIAHQGEWMLLDDEAGIALKKTDRDKKMAYHHLQGKAIISKKKRQTKSEEARLMYVAMTRARERLILTSTHAMSAAALSRWAGADGEGAALGALSMMDWLGASLYPALEPLCDGQWTAPNGANFAVSFPNPRELRVPTPREEELPDSLVPREPPGEQIRRRMAPLQVKPGHPLKLSVTQLTRDADDVPEESPQTKRRAYAEAPGEAAALSREERIQRGISAHKALGSVHLQRLRSLVGGPLQEALTAEIERLWQAGILTQLQRDTVDVPHLAAFFESDVGRGLLEAGEVHREWPFTMLAEDGLVVQGVLDCCFLQDGAWVLIDYKTDRADAHTIHARYRDQMRWYMRALKEITGIPVREAYLLALRTMTFIPVAGDTTIRYGGL